MNQKRSKWDVSGGIVVLIILSVLLIVAAKANGAVYIAKGQPVIGSAPNPESGIDVTVVRAPRKFSYGEILSYRVRVTNKTPEVQAVELLFVFDEFGSPILGKGGGNAVRRIVALGAFQTRPVIIRAMAPLQTSQFGSFCMTLWVYGEAVPFVGGPRTCAFLRQQDPV